MLNVLFDVAKTTPLRVKGDQDCFTMIMDVLKTFLSADTFKLGLASAEYFSVIFPSSTEVI